MGVSPNIGPYNLFIFSWLQVLNSLNLLIKVEIMIKKDELSLFYPKVLKGLRKLWQGREVK